MTSFLRVLALFLCAFAGVPMYSFGQTESATTPATNGSRRWGPGTNDPLVAITTAGMLEKYHYLHLKLDSSVSEKFFTTYLNTLDPQHLHFLQADMDEFEKYRETLADLVKQGDTLPGYLIFNRFMQRLEDRTAYVQELLKSDAFDFTADEEMPLSRKNAPYPKDINEAKALWKQRLRYEYLAEKLGKEGRGEIASSMLSRHNPMAFTLAWRVFADDVSQVLSKRYTRVVRNFHDWDDDKVLETYLTALGHVYDPHSDYYDRADLENFSIEMSKSLFGIGATLQMDDDGYTKIVSLVPSGPAEKSNKLKPNDRIVLVAQGTNEPVDVIGMPLNHVVDKIRGPKGTLVQLTIIPGDAVDSSTRRTVSIVRDEINLADQLAKGDIVEMPGPEGQPMRVGVIDLPSFYASMPLMGARGKGQIKSPTHDLAQLLARFKKEDVKGVILDLRHNGGGSLEEAINVTGLFIKDGPVVQVKGSDKDAKVDIREDTDDTIQYDGPLVVLVSRFSASASEIVAAALQDYGRAVVVGDNSTHGKGSVQSMRQLAEYIFFNQGYLPSDPASLGALKYTTNKFYRVNGSSTQLDGVTPEIILPSTYEFMELLGEKSLDNALPGGTIESAQFEKLNRVQPFVAELKKRSQARVDSDKDYAYVREDIEQVKKVMADKSISLNEQKRLKEMQENEARSRTRELELKARKWPDQKIYDLTLEHVDDPTLTPTFIATNGVFTTNRVALLEAKRDTSDTPDAGGDDGSAPRLLGPADLSPEERAPMTEAEHILMDYIMLWDAKAALTARHAQN